MKKFLSAGFFVFVMMSLVMAAPVCNSYTTVSYVGNQKSSDNEFLYKNNDDFEKSKQGYINTGNKNSGAGLAYECDVAKSSGCRPNSVVTMPPNHIFKGELIPTEQKYQCINAVFDNYWKVVEDGICHTHGFGDVAVGDCVSDGMGGCRKLTDVDCSGYRISDPSGIEFKGVCVEGPEFLCQATKCREGLVPDVNGVCMPAKKDGGAVEPVNPIEPVKPVNPVVGKCHPSVCTSDVCKACCAKPGTETIWTPSVNKCVCVNGGDFVQENGQWLCKVATTIAEPEKYICDALLLGNMAAWKNRCVNFADVLTQISALEAYCANLPDKDIFLRAYDELKSVVDTTCVEVVEEDKTVVLIGTAKSKVSEAVVSLQGLVSDLDVKKWRDADGKFNTARLASDSIAGVVLGTAGGLITSNVVQKHQVKEGFEDLKCTIGGQTVSAYGDEFRVGIQ